MRNKNYQPLPDDKAAVLAKILWKSKRSEPYGTAVMSPIIELHDVYGRRFLFQFHVIDLFQSLQPAWRVHRNSRDLIDMIQLENDGRANIMVHLVGPIQDLIRGVMDKNLCSTRFGMYSSEAKRLRLYESWVNIHPDFVSFTGVYPGIKWIHRSDLETIKIEQERHSIKDRYPTAAVHGL